jgi:hypothetical protein
VKYIVESFITKTCVGEIVVGKERNQSKDCTNLRKMGMSWLSKIKA